MGLHDDVVKDLKAKIKQTLDELQQSLAKIRTGRASAAMLDGVKVDYYGTPTPLASAPPSAVPEPRLITVKPWDKSIIKEIEKAIREANLGFTPMNDGEIIRLPIPAAHRGAPQGHRQAGEDATARSTRSPFATSAATPTRSSRPSSRTRRSPKTRTSAPRTRCRRRPTPAWPRSTSW